jgi:hypothetical protein
MADYLHDYVEWDFQMFAVKFDKKINKCIHC